MANDGFFEVILFMAGLIIMLIFVAGFMNIWQIVTGIKILVTKNDYKDEINRLTKTNNDQKKQIEDLKKQLSRINYTITK